MFNIFVQFGIQVYVHTDKLNIHPPYTPTFHQF
jgi:hypothetical protein